MSSTQFVHYRDKCFAAFDVSLGVFLKHLIDAAEAKGDAQENTWLADAVQFWRVAAAYGGGFIGLRIEEDWSESQLATFIELAKQACTAIGRRSEFSADEVTSWVILDDMRLFTRGEKVVRTGPIVELGQAIIALADGSLPSPPEGHRWHFGLEGGPRTYRLWKE